MADAVKQETAMKKAEKTEEKKEKSAQKNAGFCIYIGPTIMGVIQANTIYPGTLAEVLKRAEVISAIQKFPEIQNLIVDGSGMTESKTKVKTKGDALYRAYSALIKR